jgi:hypothetical protein
MKNCQLCKIKKADKTGSHIIPHFLMKRIDNEIGKKGRDRELGFTIGEIETTSYFGQSVLPEKLNEIFGELSDKEIENNQAPLIVDHFFCTDCELKLSQIENEYAKTLENKGVDSKVSSEICFLFWISIIWRISIFKKQGLILKSKEEERLRRILNKYLTLKIENIDSEAIKNDLECQNLSYRLIRCPDYSEDEATYLFCHPFHKMPYSILIDEYVLFFYFKKGHIDNLVQTFLGFEKELKGKITNTVTKGENKILYDKKAFKGCLNNLVNLITDKRFENYNWLFDEAHKKMGGQGDKMPSKLKQSIKDRMISNEKKLGRKFTFKDLVKSMYEEMIKYAP